uniref:PAS domain-containing protein n=1 Tax=Daphnia galeata TaxID=27404 RepID=A0A8J2RWT7_9CRUS|nr:unnamed protein product [Daphnia galeata]
MLYEDKCSMADSCWLKALGGMLLALSSEGDIIYLTENVIQQLGIQQLDLIGRSVFDYCHPCDQNELRGILSLRRDGELERSCFLRFKSTLAGHGRINNNKKNDNYKVMNCSGRIVMATASNVRLNCSLEDYFHEEHELESDSKGSKVVKSSTSHFLVLVCDPIPHPSKVELALDSHTFVTNHTLDMNFSYVDEKMCQFFGYTMEDLKYRSAYEFHHAQDNESILKSYKTMITKGQIQTPPYRFLAKQGGYAWVQTQATVVSVSNQYFRSQAVVCIHTRLSDIEERDQIFSISQC